MSYAQDNATADEEDKSKMIREVIDVVIDKPAPATPVEPVAPDPNNPEAVPQQESSTMPCPAGELVKRANDWYNLKNKKYIKSNGATGGNKVACVASFPYKPKELNPINDVEGEITMNVTIECKDGKYRYTIDKMMHKAKKEGMSGGDVYNPVPACGSMKITELIWKQIKSAALANAKLVSDELKANMKKTVAGTKKDDW
jgi:hypothetical protein